MILWIIALLLFLILLRLWPAARPVVKVVVILLGIGLILAFLLACVGALIYYGVCLSAQNPSFGFGCLLIVAVLATAAWQSYKQKRLLRQRP